MVFAGRIHDFAKRICTIAVFSIPVAAALPGHMPANAADQLAALTAPTFVARDATRFAENPDLSAYGLKDIIVAYESSLWPAGASKTEPDLNYIANNYIPKIRSKNPDVVVIDIEVCRSSRP